MIISIQNLLIIQIKHYHIHPFTLLLQGTIEKNNLFNLINVSLRTI